MRESTQKRINDFCKKWGLSDSHLKDLNEIFENHEKERQCEGALMISVPDECDLVLVAYLKGKEIIKTITVDAETNDIHSE